VGGESAWVRDPTGLVVRQLHLRVAGRDRILVSGGGAEWDTAVRVTDANHVTLDSSRGTVTLERER